MILGQPGSEQYRTRLGLFMLVVGIILLLWTWSSWVYRAGVPAKVEGHATELATESASQRIQMLRSSPLFLMVFFVLILAFLVGSFVVVRTIRRYKEALARQQSAPTASDDVWSMPRPLRDAEEVDV